HSDSVNLYTKSDGQTVFAADLNQFYTALRRDLIPKDVNGDSLNNGGSLGSSTYQWLKAFINSGYWDAGDLKYHMDYSGATPIGQGWYPCDGTTINETNYDALHGAGSWDIYVISSPLDGETCGSTDN